MPDLGRLMHNAAAKPQRGPDVERAFRQGRRARVMRYGLLSTSAAVTAVAIVLAATTWVSDDDRRISPAPEAGTEGRIVFARFGSGIMTMNADGTGQSVVAASNQYAVDRPALSPDGSKIAFHGFYDEANNESGGLFVMDADGSKRRLVEVGGDAPMWSPDGRWMAFENHGVIRVASAEGGDPFRASDHNEADSPTWAPTSDRLAFRGCCREGDEVYGVDIPPRRIDQLTNEEDDGASGAYWPAWSPDGSTIVHKRIRYDAATQTDSEALYVMDPDGSGLERITNEYFFDGAPVWSPDGSKIAFAARRSGDERSSIFVLTIGGKEQELAEGGSPTWSPDGARIAFERAEGTDASHIYSIDVDGTDERQLTFGDVADHSPDWGPSPEPDCGTIDIGSDEYGVELSGASGTAGSTIEVTGTTLRGENGRWVPSDRIEMWWNTDKPDGGATNDGPVLELLEISDMDACTFESSFEVPDVSPGTYWITTFVFDEGNDGSYGFFGHFDFKVTSLDRCGGPGTSGGTPPSRWLRETVTQLGVPGIAQVDPASLDGASTALEIAAYGEDKSLYLVLLEPFRDNEDWGGPENQVGTYRGFRVLEVAQEGSAWEAYQAESADWQLSLIAYPGREGRYRWPEGTLDWMNAALDRLSEAPPDCEEEGPRPQEPERPGTTIAEGELPSDAPGRYAGLSWRALAWTEPDRWCLGLETSRAPGDPMSVCNYRGAETTTVFGPGTHSANNDDEPGYIWGVVREDAMTLKIEYPNGDSQPVGVIVAPLEMDIGARTYFAFVDELKGAKLVAINADGQEIGSKPLDPSRGN